MSHRKNISMEQEYGLDKSLIIKKKISNTVKQSLKGKFQYNCTKCNTSFNSNIRLSNKIKYCSDECKGNKNICSNCNTLLNKVKRSKQIFCNKKCYWEWMKNNIQPPRTENRRLKSNSPEAIKKRRCTNIKNGLWSDSALFIEDYDYKQYLLIVRQLTKSLRPKIFEAWDGYDEYDGEYIKDNFKLHYTNGDYPSIDHKISVLKAFNLQWPPSKTCSLDNLVVTKKRLNSKKQQKEYLDFKSTIKYEKNRKTTR